MSYKKLIADRLRTNLTQLSWWFCNKKLDSESFLGRVNRLELISVHHQFQRGQYSAVIAMPWWFISPT